MKNRSKREKFINFQVFNKNMKYEPTVKSKGTVKLDLKDKKILKILEHNSRQSYSRIAKKVGLSKEGVRYRIKHLEEKGVIQQYKVVVDVKKLNYRAYHIFVTLNNPELKFEKDYIKKLKEFPFIRAVIKFNGDYDFEIAMVAKDIAELDENISQLLRGINKFIKKQEMLIVVRSYVGRTLPKNFLDYEEPVQQRKEKEIKIEDKDLEILNVMRDNANMPTYQIAKKLNVSTDIVSYRLKKMQEGNFILKYTPAINYSALSYQVYAILLNIAGLYGETENKLGRFLKEDKNVLWGVKTIGRYNVMIYICTKKSEDLHDTINKIRNTFSKNIKDYKTLIAYEEYIYTYFPNLFLV